MRSYRASRFILNPAPAFLLAALATGACAVESPPDLRAEELGTTSSALTAREFVIRSFTGKCFDFGGPQFHAVGSPVMLYACNGTAAQHIRVEEVDPTRHRVVLRDGGSLCVAPVLAPDRRLGTVLTLQECNGSTDQQYTIDGDSIVSLVQPGFRDIFQQRFVVEVQRGTTANRTPLVLGSRETEDSERWTFTARDGSGAKPTTGFRVARNANDLVALLGPSSALEPGSVVEVEGNIALPKDDNLQLVLREGVTLRGNRRGLTVGPTISTTAFPTTLIKVEGTDTRITGLTLRGPTGGTSAGKGSGGIGLDTTKLSIVDHNDLSQWTAEAVEVRGNVDGTFCRGTWVKDPSALVLRNYIHENARQGDGYGVAIYDGGNALIQGNVFDYNRHAIAASYDAFNRYAAFDNLVLPSAPSQLAAGGLVEYVTHDFDAHGSNKGSIPEFTGGRAGDFYDVGWNTFTAWKGHFLNTLFLFGDRENFNLRGTPCLGARYHDNVSRQSEGDSVANHGDTPLVKWGNVFNASDPLADLRYGDFDGDGRLDSLAATGTGWFMRSGTTGPWTFLRRSAVRPSQLTLADVDGDGRTDITYTSGRTIYTAWAGSSLGDQTGSLPPLPGDDEPHPEPPTPPGGSPP